MNTEYLSPPTTGQFVLSMHLCPPFLGKMFQHGYIVGPVPNAQEIHNEGMKHRKNMIDKKINELFKAYLGLSPDKNHETQIIEDTISYIVTNHITFANLSEIHDTPLDATQSLVKHFPKTFDESYMTYMAEYIVNCIKQNEGKALKFGLIPSTLSNESDINLGYEPKIVTPDDLKVFTKQDRMKGPNLENPYDNLIE